MPETRISDEASFQARWNDKRVVVRVRAEDADVQATDAVKLTTADGILPDPALRRCSRRPFRPWQQTCWML